MPPMVPPTIALVWVGEEDAVTEVVMVDELFMGFEELDEVAVGLGVVVGLEVVLGLSPEEGELPSAVDEKVGVKMGDSAETGAVVDDIG